HEVRAGLLHGSLDRREPLLTAEGVVSGVVVDERLRCAGSLRGSAGRAGAQQRDRHATAASDGLRAAEEFKRRAAGGSALQLSDDEDVVRHVRVLRYSVRVPVTESRALDGLVGLELGDQVRGLLLRRLTFDEFHLRTLLRDEQ